MKEIKKLTKEIVFKKKVVEVSSISLDDSYEYLSDKVLGEFIVSGIVKHHDFGNLKEDFNEKFEISYDYPVNTTNVSIEITDFTYDILDNRIILDIEYGIDYEEKVIEDSIEELLDNDNIEVIDFRDEEIKETEPKKTDKLEEEKELERVEVTDDNEYILYHVYTVNNNDTLDLISNKYNVSIEIIKDYNSIDEIKPGVKLIIPCNND